MINEGVTIEACKACADKYNASEILKSLGVNVRYTGEALTSYIKSDNKLLSI